MKLGKTARRDSKRSRPPVQAPVGARERRQSNGTGSADGPSVSVWAARRPRVFGIGLNKTATTSFHAAMQILGLVSHHTDDLEMRRRLEASEAAGRPLLSDIDQRIDAFSDVGMLSGNFHLLDRQYPGSRFVLTVRPVDTWIDSRRRHVERNIERRAAGEYHGDFLEIDEERWRRQWQHHVGRARRYFAGRDDFLEIDLTTGLGWQPLCELLDLPVPDRPFPWRNRDEATSDQPGGTLAQSDGAREVDSDLA